MKVMITYPPLEGKGTPMLSQNRQFQWFSVGSYIYPLVPALAATLLKQEGFEVCWNDSIAQGWNWPRFEAYFLAEKPDLVALETKTPIVRQHWRIIGQMKALHPTVRIVLLGDHVTALPEESLEHSIADFILTGGDYDLSLLGLARHLREGTTLPPGTWFREDGGYGTTGPFQLVGDLNELPFIDRQLTNAQLYGEKWKKRVPFFYTMVGRDCAWGKCTFCAWTVTYPKFRTRRPESLLDEIGFLIREHGAREVFDDTGTFPAGGWLKRFCEGMVERGFQREILFSCNMRYGFLTPSVVKLMKKAGFRKLKMGFESANQDTLDRIDKGVTVQRIIDDSKMISEAGLDIQLTIMVGYPWESREDAQRTVDLARMLMSRGYAEMLQATVLVPYPGTPLFRDAVRNDWFRIPPAEYERFDMREPVFKTPDMTPEEVMRMCNDVYQSFLTPRYMLRQLSRVRGWEDVSYLLRGSKAIFGHLLDFGRSSTERANPKAVEEWNK